MDKYQDRYRISSSRANWWNYSRNGIYFITICTSGHDVYFGKILDKQLISSEIGILVHEEWENSFNIRQELICESFVIMPNHIHALLKINNPDFKKLPVTPGHGIAYRRPKSISSFVAGFKSAVTSRAVKINSCFGWQYRFHDHIVRDDQEYERIDTYIRNNPGTWENDKFFRH